MTICLATGTAFADAHVGATLGINNSAFFETTRDDKYHPIHGHVRATVGGFVRLSRTASPWSFDLGIALSHESATRTECGFVSCDGVDSVHMTWSFIDLELPLLARRSRPLADDLALTFAVGLAPSYSLRAYEYQEADDPGTSTSNGELDTHILRIDVAALAGVGVELTRSQVRYGLEIRGSVGLVDRDDNEEYVSALHAYGVYVLGTVLYGP